PGFLIKESGVASLHIAVRRHCLGRLYRILEILHEHARRLELYFAGFGDANDNIWRRRADRVREDFAIRLTGDIQKCFGLSVELLQVQPDRAIEYEQIGADRLASRIGNAHAREPEHILERFVNEYPADGVKNTARKRHWLAGENSLTMLSRDRQKIVK